MRHLPPSWSSPVFCRIFLFLCVLVAVPAFATVWNVKTNCGATGNGTTDDTAAINTCIGHLANGDTLLFPAGTYYTSSQLNVVGLSNVTIDGSNNTATILGTAGGTSGVMAVGTTSVGGSFGSPLALSTTANALATSFTTTSSLGVSAGDYIFIFEGGIGGTPYPTDCNPVGCRGEVLQVASVSGNTISVTTALHDTYVPTSGAILNTNSNACSTPGGSTGNCASAEKILNPVTNVTVQNITFNAQNTSGYALTVNGTMNSLVSGVTAKNAVYAPFLTGGVFGLTVTNMTITNGGVCTGTGGYSAALISRSGNLNINGLTVTGMPSCSTSDAFGPEFISTANASISNMSVDAAGAYGRPIKLGAVRYSTFTNVTAKNEPQPNNGWSFEYYSSYNTVNNCTVTNNGGSGVGTGNSGINLFGNYNQHNTFNNCTVTGNGNVQYADGVWLYSANGFTVNGDSDNTISGGTYNGSNASEPGVINNQPANFSVLGATINGPGPMSAGGLSVTTTNGCINNNTFGAGTFPSGAQVIGANGAVGSGNLLNGFGSNLTSGTCGSGSISPPTGLTAIVH